ncbi:MAG: chromate efflux transporter [Ignavibacteriaceae bacterium]|nr:chromate efflux transporter [Ignavibacteriaceae bacterium]
MIKLREIAALFLKLGFTAFGGPAAHIAMMEDEVVKKRKWITHDHFLDLLGATNLIPGPNSTEMAIHIGYVKAGWKGLITAGVCFIMPASIITLILAYLYKAYGTMASPEAFISGMHPAIIAVIFAAMYRLSRPKMKNYFMLTVMALVAVLNLAGIDEVFLLICSGVLGIIWELREKIITSFSMLFSVNIPAVITGLFFTNNILSISAGATPAGIFLFFLKIGMVLYGSGYVLIAYLQGGLVESRHWLTHKQLLDAIAIGQFTPGPVLSTATFIGYQLTGITGAVSATAAIFLPSFLLILLIGPFIPKIRKYKAASGFLNGVNAASLGLMLSVTLLLAKTALTNLSSVIIFLLAVILLVIKNVNAVWIILGSAAAGWALFLLKI